MRPGRETVEALVALPGGEAAAIVRELGEAALAHLCGDWPAWVHAGQEAARGGSWRVCLMFGRARLRQDPGGGGMGERARRATHPGARIALVAANLDEARRVMVEGPSGLLAAARRRTRRLRWEPSLRRLDVRQRGAGASSIRAPTATRCAGPSIISPGATSSPNGAQARGDLGQSDARPAARATRPRVLVTTTPRPVPALRADLGGGDTVRDARARAADNPHYAGPCSAVDAARLRRHAARAAGAGRRADRGCRGGAVAAGADREDGCA